MWLLEWANVITSPTGFRRYKHVSLEKSMAENIGYFHQARPAWMYHGKLVDALL